MSRDGLDMTTYKDHSIHVTGNRGVDRGGESRERDSLSGDQPAPVSIDSAQFDLMADAHEACVQRKWRHAIVLLCQVIEVIEPEIGLGHMTQRIKSATQEAVRG